MATVLSMSAVKAMRPLVVEAVRDSIRDIDTHTTMSTLEEREKLSYLSGTMETCLQTAECALESSMSLKSIATRYSHDATLCSALKMVEQSQSVILKKNVKHLYESAMHYESEYSPGSSSRLFGARPTPKAALTAMGSGSIADHFSAKFLLKMDDDSITHMVAPPSDEVTTKTATVNDNDDDDNNAEYYARCVAGRREAAAQRYTYRFSGEEPASDELKDASDDSGLTRKSSALDYEGSTIVRDDKWRQNLIKNALYLAQFCTAILILIKNSTGMTDESVMAETSTPASAGSKPPGSPKTAAGT